MDEKRKSGISTISVHAGGLEDRDYGAVNTPVYLSTTFKLSDADYEAILNGKARDIWVYTRYGNPSRRAVELKVAALEGAEDGLAFASGMAAISTTLLTFLRKGDHLLTTLDLYGGTSYLIQKEFPKFGIDVTSVNPQDINSIKNGLKPNTKVVYFETLSNPLLKFIDLEAVAELAHGNGALFIVDNTFMTPFNLRPLEHGVDIVVHSGSKYLNGHSDVISGFVVGSEEHIGMVWETMLHFGGSMEPLPAYLVERGLKTFAIRMERHNTNAMAVAEFLKGHPRVRRVIYPGLDDYPQKELIDRYVTNGYSGMVSFEIDGTDEDGVKFMHNLKIWKEATSLGGVESLVSMPYNTSHAGLTPEQRQEMGIGPGFIRLSCGIEDADDLIADIDQALNSV